MQQYKYARDGMIPVSNGDWVKKEAIPLPPIQIHVPQSWESNKEFKQLEKLNNITSALISDAIKQFNEQIELRLKQVCELFRVDLVKDRDRVKIIGNLDHFQRTTLLCIYIDDKQVYSFEMY